MRLGRAPHDLCGGLLARRSWAHLVAAGVGVAAAGGCQPDGWPDALELRQPTGLSAVGEGRWLAAVNGNFDGERVASSVIFVDAHALAMGIADPVAQAADRSRTRPCSRAGGGPLRCDPALLIDPELTRMIPVGGLDVARQRGPTGDRRLLIPVRSDPSLSWLTVSGLETSAPQVDCDHDARGVCDAGHVVEGLAPEPARLTVASNAPVALLPHLLGSTLTLLGLDGEGPEIRDVEAGAFQLFEDSTIPAGGLGVAERPCHPTEDAPPASVGCTRPYFYAADRYGPSLRAWRVAPGVDVALGGASTVLPIAAPSGEEGPAPTLGDLRYESGEPGADLLVVQSSPPFLHRVRTALTDPMAEPIPTLVASAPVCSYPNLVEVLRRPDEPALAFVSCFAADRVAVVDLGTFAVIAEIEVGRGPNDMAVLDERGLVVVANIHSGTLSVIDARFGSLSYLTELAVIERSPERR